MITQRILRNMPYGLLKKENLPIILRPKYTMSSSTNPRPIKYAKSPMSPTAKLAGKIVANKTVYVGLQLENTGPSAAPRPIGHQIHSR